MGQMKQILIAGNNETNIENLKDILAEDYKILSAENENRALHFLRKYKDEIALILLEFQGLKPTGCWIRFRRMRAFRLFL